MSISRPRSPSGASNSRPFYITSFTRRAHQILKMGYDRLDCSSFRDSEEEDITGELVKTMRLAIEDRAAPRWTHAFWISEEVPIDMGERKGKRRRRIDIEIVANRPGVRPKFQFEAKRLADSTSRSKYLGQEGLGRFLAGLYAPESEVVGMLGYVQDGTTAVHSEMLGAALNDNPQLYGLSAGGEWVQESIIPDLKTFRTCHDRPSSHAELVVLHSLLQFF